MQGASEFEAYFFQATNEIVARLAANFAQAVARRPVGHDAFSESENEDGPVGDGLDIDFQRQHLLWEIAMMALLEEYAIDRGASPAAALWVTPNLSVYDFGLKIQI